MEGSFVISVSQAYLEVSRQAACASEFQVRQAEGADVLEHAAVRAPHRHGLAAVAEEEELCEFVRVDVNGSDLGDVAQIVQAFFRADQSDGLVAALAGLRESFEGGEPVCLELEQPAVVVVVDYVFVRAQVCLLGELEGPASLLDELEDASVEELVFVEHAQDCLACGIPRHDAVVDAVHGLVDVHQVVFHQQQLAQVVFRAPQPGHQRARQESAVGRGCLQDQEPVLPVEQQNRVAPAVVLERPARFEVELEPLRSLADLQTGRPVSQLVDE